MLKCEMRQCLPSTSTSTSTFVLGIKERLLLITHFVMNLEV